MLARTFKNSVKLFCCNVALHYMGYLSSALGLMPVLVNRKTYRIQTTTPLTLYCILCGCLVSAVYLYTLIARDVEATATVGPEDESDWEHYFGSFTKVTWIMITFCSPGLIIGFYVVTAFNRNRLSAFLNRTIDVTLTYSSFYKGSVTRGHLTYGHVDSEEELNMVFFPFFVKMIVLHGLVVASSLAKMIRGNMLTNGNNFRTIVLSGVPFFLISLVTSYLYLQGARINYIYHKMNSKLAEVHEELQVMASTKKSKFARMSKCCEMSDLVDKLAECYNSINTTAHDLFDIYKFQICFVLIYQIVSTIHVLFTQLQVVIGYVRDGTPMDPPLFAYNVAFPILSIVDILMAIRINDSCHTICARVAKTNQSLLYFENLDIRLQRSVEMFSLLMMQNPLEISLMGMHLLDFPLALGVFDSTLTYLLIITQFYN